MQYENLFRAFATLGSNDGYFCRKFLLFAVFQNQQAAVPILRQLRIPIITSYTSHTVFLWFGFREEHSAMANSNPNWTHWKHTQISLWGNLPFATSTTISLPRFPFTAGSQMCYAASSLTCSGVPPDQWLPQSWHIHNGSGSGTVRRYGCRNWFFRNTRVRMTRQRTWWSESPEKMQAESHGVLQAGNSCHIRRYKSSFPIR